MSPLAKMAGKDRPEIRIALRCEHCDRVAERPDDEPGEPGLEAERERGRERRLDRKRTLRFSAPGAALRETGSGAERRFEESRMDDVYCGRPLAPAGTKR